jgi:hypothetical protein
MTNKVSNVSFDKAFINGVEVKPRVRCFTRSIALILKDVGKKPIDDTWLKDRSIDFNHTTTFNNCQVNYFYDLRV